MVYRFNVKVIVTIYHSNLRSLKMGTIGAWVSLVAFVISNEFYFISVKFNDDYNLFISAH